MSNSTSWITLLGLRSPEPGSPLPPTLISHYLIFQYLWAHAITSSRFLKLRYNLDHQVSPREDLIKYGQKAVESGKITQAQLNMFKRNEGAHANTIEGFPIFAAAMILGQVAGVSTTEINFLGTAYTLLRMGYFVNYLLAETRKTAAPRALLWWMGNFVCCRLIWLSGKKLNEKLIAGI